MGSDEPMPGLEDSTLQLGAENLRVVQGTLLVSGKEGSGQLLSIWPCEESVFSPQQLS